MKINNILKTKFFNLSSVEQDGKKIATILIDGPIGGYYWWEDQSVDDVVLTKERLREELKAISELNADKIIVEIDSLGGDIGHALSMADMLAKHKAEVITDAIGLVASAATVILQAGDTRRISSNMMGLIHQAQLGAYGTATQMETAVSDLKKFNDRIAKFYAKRSGKPVETFIEQMAVNDGYGEWNTPEELIAMGLVDEQYEPMKAVASNYKKPDNVILAQCGLPALDAERKKAKKQDDGSETVVLNQIVNMDKKKVTPKNVVLNTKKLNELLAKPTNELTEDEKKFLREQKAALNEIAEAADQHVGEPEEEEAEEETAEEETSEEEAEEETAEGGATTATNKGKKPVAQNNADALKKMQDEIDALKVKNSALEAKVNKKNAGPLNITDTSDPTITGEQRQLTKNQRAAAKNAAALMGNDDDDSDAPEVAPEKDKKQK